MLVRGFRKKGAVRLGLFLLGPPVKGKLFNKLSTLQNSNFSDVKHSFAASVQFYCVLLALSVNSTKI